MKKVTIYFDDSRSPYTQGIISNKWEDMFIDNIIDGELKLNNVNGYSPYGYIMGYTIETIENSRD